MPVAALEPEQALDLLCRCLGPPMLAPAVMCGTDLKYWAEALRFAGALVARQQFLPGVEERAGVWRGVWQPVLSGPDAERLARLGRAMPDACRALCPDQSRHQVLSRFVALFLDHLARSSETARRRAVYRPKEFESLHDQWLYSLRSADSTLAGAPGELSEFAATVDEWQRRVRVETPGGFRLLFRLEEPMSEAVESWTLRYLLQASDDPSLLLPAEDAWLGHGRTRALIAAREPRVREFLLAALGRAAGLCPGIEASLKTRAPASCEFDTPGAHDFLTQRAPALEQAGFGVMLPSWWTRHGARLKLTARASVTSPKLTASGGLTLDRVVAFNWQVALAGEPVTEAELAALAACKSSLVRFRGMWVQVQAEDIRAALQLWQRRSQEPVTLRQVVRMALGAEEAPGGLELESVSASGWLHDALERLKTGVGFAELPTPPDFLGTLRPYQVRGFSWLPEAVGPGRVPGR
ncbi:hypothetical protein FJY69_07930 [candidate division WOR-3 bacterium]|nr:hypothetical protein [candidate division WOR-3 bacterium]